MRIEWNKVTWYSKLVAIIVGLLILTLGFYLGIAYQEAQNNPGTKISTITK